MLKIDRKLFRTQMKKEFKKFTKENPEYRNMLFTQFVQLVKLNMLKFKTNTNAKTITHTPSSHDHVTDDLTDVMATVEEPSNAASTAE